MGLWALAASSSLHMGGGEALGICACGMCAYEGLASACPFRPRLSHLPVEEGGVSLCVHVCMHIWVHNILRCEDVLYFYQLQLVITHWCTKTVQNSLGLATSQFSNEKTSTDIFKSQNVPVSAFFTPLTPFWKTLPLPQTLDMPNFTLSFLSPLCCL